VSDITTPLERLLEPTRELAVGATPEEPVRHVGLLFKFWSLGGLAAFELALSAPDTKAVVGARRATRPVLPLALPARPNRRRVRAGRRGRLPPQYATGNPDGGHGYTAVASSP
jgi:hypothetical protein